VARLLARSRLVALFALAFSLVAGEASADWKDSQKAFREAVRNPDWKLRKQAYQGMLDQDRAEAVDEILAALAKEDNAAVVASGIKTLGIYMSTPAANALVAAAKKEKGVKRDYALIALSRQKVDAGKEGLLEILKGSDPRALALAALAVGKKQVAAAIPRLMELLRHKDWQVRVAAARALKEKALAASLTKDHHPLLLDALAAAEGRERADLIDLLATIFKQDFGNDVPAWRALVTGAAPNTIARKPAPVAHVVGIPIHGKRVSIVVDHSQIMEDPHPFTDRARLQELCKVPGARDVPWFAIKTNLQFAVAHAKRLLADLPDGTPVEVVTVGGKTMKPQLGRLTPVNNGVRQAMEKELDDLKPENGYFAVEALNAALDAGGKDSAAWSSGPDEVVVLTGGLPWLSPVTDQEVIGATIGLKAALRIVTIHVVGIGNHATTMSRTMAEETGGRYLNLAK
jgi:HEAT repeat protein